MMRFVTNELRYILARVVTKKMFVVVLVSMMYLLFLIYSDVYIVLIKFFGKTLCIFV